MNFSLAEIEKYCKDFSLKDSPLLSDLTESTWSSEELPEIWLHGQIATWTWPD